MLIVNGRFLGQPTTGVQRFAEQITRELLEIRPDVTLLVPSRTRLPSWVPESRVRRIGILGGHAWEQVELPLYLMRHDHPALLNLGSTAPARYRRQIATHHDITYIRFPESFSFGFRLLYAALIPSMLRSCRGVITVSRFSRDEISGHYGTPPDKMAIVPNAVDERFAPTEHAPRGAPYLLAVSSPNRHKNFARLLTAYGRVADSLESDLIVIGSQSSSFTKQHYAASSHHRIKFLGRVRDDELISLYQGARAFVFPSLYEGFGIPPLEAQKCGVPVIASSAASMPEVLGDSALFFSPDSEMEIAAALRVIDADDMLRARLKERGLKNVSTYSWKDSALQVSHFVDAMLMEPSRPRRGKSERASGRGSV